MKKTAVLLCISLLIAACKPGTQISPAPIGNMSHAQIDSMLQANVLAGYTVTDRIEIYSEMFLGTPYSWTATGDGPYALRERYPLVNFDSTNCMVYCEHVLALSISDSWDNFFNNLQKIRYRDGIIGMKTRNHYTMADWLPENRWLLDDVSREVGGEFTKSLTRTISHEEFFRKKGITDMRYVKLDRSMTVDYVPTEHLGQVKKKIRSGDIVALLHAKKDDIFSAHMLMIVEKPDGLYFREASTSNNSTFETPYETWLEQKSGSERYAGLAFMRVRDDVNTAGAVILPWKIIDLKQRR
ncbi:MAG: DUF1460 domain-containing protein [Candidatus Marinimicrobia bacterium]|nr:DUF1460 domain-containing protein [Candidatus Neomarinimicrobiota bacterium]